MSDTTIRLPAGVRDFLPKAAHRRVGISARLLSEFERWGYQRIITPLFECADVLERGLGGDAKATAIRFIEPASGEVVALRPDITPQVARIAATRMADIGGPLRLCYQGAVARMAQGARGQREVLQAGVELVGASGPSADAELLALAAAAMDTCLVPSRSLDIGHVVLARLALSELSGELLSDIKSCLRRKDRLGVQGAARQLAIPQRALLEALPLLFGDPEETLARARMLALPKTVTAELDELETTIAWSRQHNPDSELLRDLTLDLGELRGFEYYTGMRLQAFVKGAGGPVLRGGRYNNLVERYGRKAAATGFAVDVEAVAQAESALEVGHETDSTSGCLVVADASQRPLAAELVATLRRSEFRVALEDATAWSLDEPAELIAYAGRVNLPAVVILDSEKFCVHRPGCDESSLWAKAARGRSSHPTAQSIFDALVPMLSGRNS